MRNRILGFAAGFLVGISLFYKFLFIVCKNKDRRITMFSNYFYTLDKWMKLKNRNISLGKYLYEHGYRNIAIYGIGIMGKQLCDELNNSDIEIKYAIDKNRENEGYNFPVRKLDNNLPKVDLMIVTPSYEFDNIKELLKGVINCSIVSLDYIVKGCYDECFNR